MLSLLRGDPFRKACSSTLLVTIPKIEAPKNFGDLRPISLCNFNAKVISTLLTDRFPLILTHIISMEQSMPLHILAAFDPPKSVISRVETIFANFFWG